MLKTIKIFLLISIVFTAFTGYSQQERKHIRHGNRDYEAAEIDSVTTDTVKFQDAEVNYRKALEKDPNNWDASYNIANALYRQGKFEESNKQFQAVASLESDDKKKTAMAYHNLGNSLLQAGQIDPAIEAYKNSLRNNPEDLETKYNLAWAQNKKKQQEQNQDQNQDQDKQDQEQDQDKQDQENKDQNQDQQDEQEQQQNQDQQEQQQDQQQQQPQDQISKEDAMRILEALENDEKEVQDKVQKQKAKPQKKNTEKDW